MASGIVHRTSDILQEVASHAHLPADFGELSDAQINSVFAQSIFRPHYGGCISKDQIPHTIADRFYVVNMANHDHPGTHWTLFFNCLPTEVIYFDSYGVQPPRQIADAMRRSGKKTKSFNCVDFQQLDSSECGWWCIYVALQLLRGFSFDSIVTNPKLKTNEGERSTFNRGVLRQWFVQNGFINQYRSRRRIRNR
jgi:hypothetical protein